MSTPPPSDPSMRQAAAHAHAALMKHHELQFDFPKFEPPTPPDWLVKLLDFLGRLLKPVAPYMIYFWWALVIAALALVLFLIVRSLIRRGILFQRKQPVPSEPEAGWRPAPDAARLLLSDADALAAAGRYAEAIHLILLRSIQDIGQYRPTVLKPALTSREISVLRELPEAARLAFVHIALVVERALFAGRPVGRHEYAECREAYERFAFGDVWSLRSAA